MPLITVLPHDSLCPAGATIDASIGKHLCDVLLRHGGDLGQGWFFGPIERGIRGGTNLYLSIVRGLMRVRWAMAVVFIGLLGLAYYVYGQVPRAFVPEEDAGYFISIIQAPPGASLEYTGAVASQAEAVILKDPDVLALFSVTGFSFAGAAPNQGMMFVRLKPLEQRADESQAIRAVQGRLAGQLFAIPGAIVVSFLPPSIPGLSRFGGFEFQVLDQSGGDIANLGQATQAIAMSARQSEKVQGLFSSFTANDPQLQVTIDRQRALALGLPLNEITSALQIFLGSQYVNDFELNNRAYRVYVQADQRFRSSPADIERYPVRSGDGRMMPLSNIVSVREKTAPKTINHYNLFRSAEINGGAAPGYSSGQALQLMEDLARRTLPQGMTFEWSGLSREEIAAEVMGTGRWEGELVQIKKDGRRIVVASRWSLQRDETGAPVGFLETNNDITERKQAEEERERLRQELAHLAHLNRVSTMGELTASLAHEINQPLAAIVTNAQVCLRWLTRDVPNLEEVREAAELIARDGKRASDIISRIRALVRKTGSEKAPLDINQANEEVVHLTEDEALRKGVVLRTELAADLPFVLGDRVQLQQVLLNLIINGVEAMSSVADGPRELLVYSRLYESKQVLVGVQDFGVGIEPENLKKIFDPFYTTKSQGMGMGLAISRSIVENHGGKLWASPNDGPGATFKFTLLSYD